MIRSLVHRGACAGLAMAFVALMVGAKVAAHSPDLVLQELGDNDIAAIAGGRGYTVEELRVLLATRYGGDWAGGREPRSSDLLRATREADAWRTLSERAIAAGFCIDEATRAQLDEAVAEYRRRLFLRREVIDRVKAPSLKMLRELYEAEKGTTYLTPERFVFEEAIAVPADPSAVAGRDRLARVAREAQASGDSLVVAVSELEGDPAFADLDARGGSHAEDTTAARWQRLASMADGDVVVVDEGDRTVLLKRTLRIAPRPIPFETALERLHDAYYRRERAGLMRALLERAAAIPGLVDVDERAVLRRGSLAPDDEVLVRIGDCSFTRGALFAAGGWPMNPDVPRTLEDFRRVLVEVGPVQEALVEHLMDREGFGDPLVEFHERTLEETALVRMLAGAEAGAAGLDAATWLSREIEARSRDVVVSDVLGSHTHTHTHQQPTRGEVFADGPMLNPTAP